MLQFDIGSEGRDLRRCSQQEEIADGAVIDRDAERIFKMGDDVKTVQRQSNVDLGRELVAHAACVAAGGPHAEELFALEQKDLARAALRQVVHCTRAHASAADDNGVSGLGEHRFKYITYSPKRKIQLLGFGKLAAKRIMSIWGNRKPENPNASFQISILHLAACRRTRVA